MFAEPDSPGAPHGGSYRQFNPLDRFFLFLGRAGLDVPCLLLLLAYLYVAHRRGIRATATRYRRPTSVRCFAWGSALTLRYIRYIRHIRHIRYEGWGSALTLRFGLSCCSPFCRPRELAEWVGRVIGCNGCRGCSGCNGLTDVADERMPRM